MFPCMWAPDPRNQPLTALFESPNRGTLAPLSISLSILSHKRNHVIFMDLRPCQLVPCFLTSGQKHLLAVRPMYAHNLVESVIEIMVTIRRPTDGFDYTMVSSNRTNLSPDSWLPVLDGLMTNHLQPPHQPHTRDSCPPQAQSLPIHQFVDLQHLQNFFD